MIDLAAVRIKVCGLTTEDDLQAAIAAGADAIGLVRHEASPRHVSRERATRLVDVLAGRAVPVAVVVDAQPDEMAAWMEATGARALQLCGDQRADEWAGFPHPLLRRVSVDGAGEAELDAWAAVSTLLVLDHPSGPGGTGQAVDGTWAAVLARRAPALLAGGLDEHNVAARVAAVKPHGVDASSALEVAPGRKDAARVAAFVRAARAALNEVTEQAR